MEIKNIPITSLNPAEYNPRILTDEQKDNIKNSLTKFGFVNPIVVNDNPNRKNILIGGHQRLKVAQEMGYTEVPVVYVNLNEEQERELNIRLNRNTGEWDLESLAEHFTKNELDNWGFDNEELAVLFKNMSKSIPKGNDDEPFDGGEIDLELDYDPADKMVIIVFYDETKYNDYKKWQSQYDGEEADLIYDAVKKYTNGR